MRTTWPSGSDGRKQGVDDVGADHRHLGAGAVLVGPEEPAAHDRQVAQVGERRRRAGDSAVLDTTRPRPTPPPSSARSARSRPRPPARRSRRPQLAAPDGGLRCSCSCSSRRDTRPGDATCAIRNVSDAEGPGGRRAARSARDAVERGHHDDDRGDRDGDGERAQRVRSRCARRRPTPCASGRRRAFERGCSRSMADTRLDAGTVPRRPRGAVRRRGPWSRRAASKHTLASMLVASRSSSFLRRAAGWPACRVVPCCAAAAADAAPRSTWRRSPAASLQSFVTASGEIVATRYADIGSSAMGRLVELPVSEGDRVQAGQVLARIDRVQAASSRDGRECDLAALEADARGADDQGRRPRPTSTRRRPARPRHRRRARRAEELRRRGPVAAVRPRRAQRRRRGAAAPGSRRRGRRGPRRAGPRRRRPPCGAGPRRARPGARDQLAKTEITAPIDGVVTRLDVEEGEMVVIGVQNQPGTILMTVSDLSAINAEVKVAEADVLRLALDNRGDRHARSRRRPDVSAAASSRSAPAPCRRSARRPRRASSG